VLEQAYANNSKIKLYKDPNTWKNPKFLEDLIFESNCKIIDFGLGKDLKESDGITSSICGSPITMAPEIWQNKLLGKNKKGYNYKVDIWSTGCILFNILTNYPPFPGEEIQNICNKVMFQGEYFLQLINPDESYSEITVEYVDLISGMLQFSQEKRFSWEQVKTHPFLNVPTSKQTKLRNFLTKIDMQKEQEDFHFLKKIKKKNGVIIGLLLDINDEPFILKLAKSYGSVDLESEDYIDKNLQTKFSMENNIDNYLENPNSNITTNEIINLDSNDPDKINAQESGLDFKDNYFDVDKNDDLDYLFEFYDVVEEFYFVFEEDEDGYVLVDQVKKRKKSTDS
jgi:serine/threonine protein kinase